MKKHLEIYIGLILLSSCIIEKKVFVHHQVNK